MAMSGPSSAVISGPAGRVALGIDEMELTPLPVGVIANQAGQHSIRVSALLQPLQAADSQIGIGVGLGGHSTNAGADMRNR